MFPIAVDLTKVPILLIGQGMLLQKRQRQLNEAGAAQMTVIDFPAPYEEKMANATIIMAAGLDRKTSEHIAEKARKLGKLVNVEDVNDLCDFYFTANVRRGDLVIAVSTSGASPTLARSIRDYLAQRFGAEWEGYVSEMGALRQQWKKQGAGFQELINNSEKFLAKKEWL